MEEGPKAEPLMGEATIELHEVPSGNEAAAR
jgi:hypothetical protein